MAALSDESEDEKMVTVVWFRFTEKDGHLNKIRNFIFMHFLFTLYIYALT